MSFPSLQAAFSCLTNASLTSFGVLNVPINASRVRSVLPFTSSQPRWEESITKKKKQIPSLLWVSVCAQEAGTRLRLHPPSALHLSTGPHWIQPSDCAGLHPQHKMWRRWFGTERVSRVRLFEGAQHKAKSLPGFFSLCALHLTGKRDAGDAASPAPLE